MLLQIDGTFIVILISFLIFMWLMHIVFYVPMLKMKLERYKYIQENKRHTQIMSDSANDLKDEQEAELKQAYSISKAIIDEKVQKANEEKDEAIFNAHEKSKNALKGAKNRIKVSVDIVKSSLANDLDFLSDEIVNKILE